MASSITLDLPNCSDTSRDVLGAKHGCGQDGKLIEESPSSFSQVSCETYNSVIESQSPNIDYDSSSSVSVLKDANYNKKSEITNRDVDHIKTSERKTCSSSGMPVVRKSRVSTHLTGTESGPSDHEQGLRGKSSVTAGDKMTDLRGKLVNSGPDGRLQNRGASSDYSKLSRNNSKTSFHPEKDDSQKFDRNHQISISTFRSQSKKSDYPQARESYHIHSRPISEKERKGGDGNRSRAAILSQRNSNQKLDDTLSELTLKLRSRMESDFLSSELRKQGSPVYTNTVSGSSENFRTVDEILRHYGIENRVSSSQYQNAAYNNISQNNETQQCLETPDTGRKEEATSLKSRDALGQSLALSKTNMNSPAIKESLASFSSHPESKHAKTSGAIYKSNLSQNNETKYGTTHQDLLRKYGSSVDHSSIAAGGKYSVAAGSRSHGRYDYGRSTTLLGDVVSGASAPYANKNFQDYEVKQSTLLSRQLEGSQVDILKPNDMAINKGDDFNTIRLTGSSTDAVEFTLSNERERLRKLDNLIMSTSVTTSDPRAHKNLMTRYLSPGRDRDYENLRASSVINKVYSSPTFPSSRYAASMTAKRSWASGVGQYNTSMLLGRSASVPTGWHKGLGKTASVPTSWNNGFQSVTDYSSSVDVRPSYLPHYSNRIYDHQFNNSTRRSFSLERLASQINSSKNQAISLQNRKQEIPLRRKAKQGILAPAQHTNYNQSRYPLENNSNMSMFSAKSDGSSKSGSRKNANAKQTASRNISDSKSTSEIYGCLAIMKNRNKPSQGGHVTKTTMAKARQTHRVSSVSPHASLSQVRKVETFHDLAKELFKNDSSQAPSKSKPARTGGRKVSNHVDDSEKLHERVRQSDAPPSRGHLYFQSSHTPNNNNKRVLRAMEKNKERIATEILIQRTKLTNKHHNHVSGSTTGIYKPHSMVATSSRSFPEFATRLPGFQGFLDHKFL
ncbi:hypothetical protein BsWGS_17622 [Bradybaena similaris]